MRYRSAWSRSKAIPGTSSALSGQALSATYATGLHGGHRAARGERCLERASGLVLDDFFSAAAAFDEDALARVLHPEARISEMPNAINRAGSERGFEAAREAFARGRGLLSAQAYDVHDVIVDGDKMAARATWRGTLTADGRELTAHIATFSEVRDGRIFRHATYDCYEAFA